jgi:conjugative relaxase-like TrwC/TraI family protein
LSSACLRCPKSNALHIRICDAGAAAWLEAWVALPTKALKVGQEDYWLDQIARDREEYFSGHGESPGRYVGSAAAASGLSGIATAEQVRAMFQGQDPATGEQRCQPLLRADPRSKLPAGPLLTALREHATAQGVSELAALGRSKALAGDVRAVVAACRAGGARRVKVETAERLCRMLLHIDPRSLYGQTFDAAWQHRGRRIDARVAAFDLCFSSPKSVSLLAAGGGAVHRAEVNAARATALAAAVAYLEANAVGVRREHNGVDRYQVDGGLLAVSFEHRSSRADDPQAHAHVLVQNAALGPDGRWSALDSDRLYAHLMAADHLYLAVERAELTRRLGVRWTGVDRRSGAAEIVGLEDRALLRQFSKRSAEIDDWLAEQGLAGIKASSAAAVATRQPKQHGESEEQLYARWERELGEQGITAERLVEVCGSARGRPATAAEVDAILQELGGPQGLTEQASTFARRDVLDAVVKRLPVATSAEQLVAQAEQVTDRFLAERAVPVTRDRRLDEPRWSTPELLALEQRLLTDATERQQTGCTQVAEPLVTGVLARHGSAGADQAAMVRDLCRAGDGVAVVVGRAGTGKTWALGLAREAFEQAGYQVLGCAPTGIATVGLGQEGFADVRTVDRLQADLAGRRLALDDRTVLVVDEAGMVATRKLAPLLDHAERAGAKVVLVGDDRQFSPVDAGGGFRALRLRLGASELTVNRRQAQAWEQQAIDLVRGQRVEEAIAAYREHDRIRVYESRQELAVGLVNDWFTAHRAGEQAVILAHRRAEVDRLNTACQQLRALHGELSPERLQVADRTFHVGDQVVLGANAIRRLGVANGTSGQVVALDPHRRTLTIQTEADRPATVRLPGWYLDGEVRPGQSRRVDLAYARTDMRAQGLTRQRALLSLDGCEDTQGLYVQLSRARERTDLYLSVTPEPPLADQERAYPQGEPTDAEVLLARALDRDGGKQLATDEHTQALSAQALRRLSTRQLRELRDRLDRERASCPPDQAAAARRAAERAAADEQARCDAEATRDAARQDLAGKASGLRGMARPRQATTGRLDLAAAERRLEQATGVAAGSAERADALRRATQQRQAWLEANDARLTLQQRAVAWELAWRNRADAAALAAARPAWLEAALGPLPDHHRSQVAWREAAVALDGYRRLWGLPDPMPAKHSGRAERSEAAAPAGRPRRGRPTTALLGREPRDLAQRRDWRAAQNALDLLHSARDGREHRQDRRRWASRGRDDERAIS